MKFVTQKLIFSSDSFTLTGYLSYPDSVTPLPGVLFIHGGGKYTENLYASWQEYLCKYNYASFFFYHRGVGESEGIFEQSSLSERLIDAKAALTVFMNSGIVDKDRLCVYGSSMGGHLAVRLAVVHSSIKAIVLQSSAAYSLKAETLPLNTSFTQEINRAGSFLESPIFDLLRQYEGKKLLVYGEQDIVIPEAVKSLYKQAVGVGNSIVILGGKHKLLRPENELEQTARDILYREVVEFLDKSL